MVQSDIVQVPEIAEYIVALNVRSGGGDRARQICDYLDNYKPHTVVLTEWRNNPTGWIFEQWAEAQGMQHRNLADGSTANGVFVASRDHFEMESATPTGADPGVLMTVRFANREMLACYFPQLNAKAAFFDRCSEIIMNDRRKPFLLPGDLNTGNQIADKSERAMKYFCAEGFDRLCRPDGLVDLWRRTNGDVREWTWMSNSGNGFRIDHALANEDFCELFKPTCTYDHRTRLIGLTDHSALIIETKRSEARRITRIGVQI
jgi:exonuclease III